MTAAVSYSAFRPAAVRAPWSRRREDAGSDLLWSRFDQRSARASAAGWRVVAVGFDARGLSALQGTLGLVGAAPAAALPEAASIAGAVAACPTLSHVVVNLDAFADLDSAVDSLLEFRRHHADVSVILVSADVSGDDFGTERRAIGDVTLRAPVTAARLRDALVSAAAA